MHGVIEPSTKKINYGRAIDLIGRKRAHATNYNSCVCRHLFSNLSGHQKHNNTTREGNCELEGKQNTAINALLN